jgi:hypothetical protein
MINLYMWLAKFLLGSAWSTKSLNHDIPDARNGCRPIQGLLMLLGEGLLDKRIVHGMTFHTLCLSDVRFCEYLYACIQL